jgi:hypothetical protein
MLKIVLRAILIQENLIHLIVLAWEIELEAFVYARKESIIKMDKFFVNLVIFLAKIVILHTVSNALEIEIQFRVTFLLVDVFLHQLLLLLTILRDNIYLGLLLKRVVVKIKFNYLFILKKNNYNFFII